MTRHWAAALVSSAACLLVTAPESHAAAVDRPAAAKKALAALDARKGDTPLTVFGLRRTVAARTRVTQAGPAGAPLALRRSRVSRRLARAGVTGIAAGRLVTAREASWLFYADEGPSLAFEHPGRVVLVGASSGKVTVTRRLRWVPLVNGRLPAFFATHSSYRSKAYRVFNRPWKARARTAQATARPAAITPETGAAQQRLADALAAERSCVLRVSDTLGDFYDFGRVDKTRASLGRIFKNLSQLNAGFPSARYATRAGSTPIQSAQQLIEDGCRDIFVYAAGSARRSGQAGIVVGLRPRGAREIQWHTLTAAALERLVRANRGVTFKFVFDAPFSGRIAQRLSDESNVSVLLTSGGADEPSFTYLPEVLDGSGIIRNTANPFGFLEFTNGVISGLERFVLEPSEIDHAIAEQVAGRSDSVLAWMLARSLDLGPSPFSSFLLGRRDQLVPFTSASRTPPPAAAPNRAPSPTTPTSFVTAEDTARAITLTGTDPDGDPLSFAVTAQPAHGTLSGVAPNLTYTPGQDFNGNDTFTYRVSDNRGAEASETITVRVTPDNDSAAVIGGPSAPPTTYTEHDPAVVVDSALTVTDVDSTSLVSATAEIASGRTSGDQLLFTDTAAITGTYDSGTGVLTLTGPAPPADYQAALRSVEFETTSNDPGPTRTVRFRAFDGDELGVPADRSIAITEVNDAPVNTVPGAKSTDEDTPLILSGADQLSVADADARSDALQVTLTAGLGTLTIDDTTGLSFTSGDGTGDAAMTFTGAQAAVNAAIDVVRFDPTADASGLGGIQLVTDDQGSNGMGGAMSDTDAIALTVNPVNDAPVVSLAAGDVAYSEGGSAALIDAALTVTDVDHANLQSATVRIASGKITGDVLTNDALPAGITTTGYDSASGALTLTATAPGGAPIGDFQAALRTVRFGTTSDNPGTARTIDVLADDGPLEGSDSRGIAVTETNDNPIVDASSGSASYAENDPDGVIVDPGVTVTDVDDVRLVSATVSITANFAAGADQLTFPATSGFVSHYDSATGVLTMTSTTVGGALLADFRDALRSVRFRTDGDDPSALTRTVSFVVNDGDANSSADSRDVTVTTSNDAPALNTPPGTSSFDEVPGNPVTVAPALTLSDPDDTNLESAEVKITGGLEPADDELTWGTAPLGVSVTYTAATGTLAISGTSSEGSYETFLRTVQFDNTSTSPGASRTITFKANDGDADNAATNDTRTIDISSVNDAPVIAGLDGAAAYTENDPATILDTDATVADTDTANLTGGTVTIAGGTFAAGDELTFTDQGAVTGAYDSGTGVLTISGTGTLAAYQAFIRTVGFRTTSDTPAAHDRTVEFQVTDGESSNDLSNVATKTVTVTAANDAPVVTTTAGNASYTENAAPATVDGAVTVTDADDTHLASASVAITNVQSGDELHFTDTGEIDGTYAAGTLTLLPIGGQTPGVADFQTALRSVTFSSSGEDPDTTPRIVNFSANDGDASSTTASRTVNVVAVNDSPVLAGNDAGTLTYTEDSPSEDHDLGIVPNLAVTDADDADLTGATVQFTAGFTSAEDALVFVNQNGITGTYNTGTGVLTLAGTTTAADYQTALRSVAYENDSDHPSTAQRTVSFEVTDGHTGENPLSNTVSRDIDVVRTNDAPVPDDEELLTGKRAISNTALVVNDPTDTADTPDPAGPQKTVEGDVLAGDTDPDNDASQLTVVGNDNLATADGGTVDIEPDGDFVYHPGAGDGCGADTQDEFDYTVTDNETTGGGPQTATGTVKINLYECVWYVDSSLAAAGDGTSDTPYNSLGDLDGAGGAGDVDDTSDKLFLYDGTYAGGIPLENQQQVLSQRHGLTVSDGDVGTTQLHAAAAGDPATTITGGVVLGSGNTLQGIHFGDATGASLRGTSVGTATVNTTTSGAITTAAGTGGAVDISDGTLNMQFSGVSSTGSTGDGIRLDNAAGTFNAAGGAIADATGQAVDLSGNGVGDDVDFTYGGTISDSAGPATLISIANQSGGTRDFNGTVSSTGAGISIQNNGNGGLTRFDGGLTLSTGAANGLVASGGGELAIPDANGPVTVPNNTITTTGAAPGAGGTALSVSLTPIHADDLEFRSISANNANTGIVVNDTGSAGSLEITGDGTSTCTSEATCTGGAIKNSGTGISLTSTAHPVLTRMFLQNATSYGIRGTTLSGLTMDRNVITGTNGTSAGHGSVVIDNLTGSATVSNTAISGARDTNFDLNNTAAGANLDRITFTNVNIGANSTTNGNDGMQLESHPAAGALKATITGSTFTSSRGDLLQFQHGGTGAGDLVMTGNALSNNHPAIATGGGGVFIAKANTGGTTTYDVQNNTFRDALGIGVQIVKTQSSAPMSGTFSGNAIGVAGTANSGSKEGAGLVLQNVDGSALTAAITNNQIHQYNRKGIELIAGGISGVADGDINATITGNTIANFGNNPALAESFINGIFINNGTSAGQTHTVCADIKNNNVHASGRDSATPSGVGARDIFVEARQSTTTRLPGYGGNVTDMAAIQNFLISNNLIGGTPTALATKGASASYTGSGTTC